jgi:hypothetical protein
VKDYLAPFAIALVACSVLFLALDYSIMKLQGLSLFFNP